ncbi:MAG: hypothetical protein MZV70_47125 [Desulfobacterales bacterium]|nr:hypothetical protein [Desulfobacterales bacterium]
MEVADEDPRAAARRSTRLHGKEPDGKATRPRSRRSSKDAEKRAGQGCRATSRWCRCAVDAQTISRGDLRLDRHPRRPDAGRRDRDRAATWRTCSGERIIGQDHALDAIAQMIQTAHAGHRGPVQAHGVFLLVGPSGVGKTETALALSDLLYGGEQQPDHHQHVRVPGGPHGLRR